MKLLRLVCRNWAARASTAFWAGRRRSCTLLTFKGDVVLDLLLRMVSLPCTLYFPHFINMYVQCPYARVKKPPPALQPVGAYLNNSQHPWSLGQNANMFAFRLS